MQNYPHDYRIFLKREFEARCERNARYSLRAFARDLGLSSARLSEILNYKCGLSRASALKLVQHLSLDDKAAAYFIDLVESSDARSHVKRQLASIRVQHAQGQNYTQIKDDVFRVISDWYCLALLELTELDCFESNVEWIANALRIPPEQADEAIERLKRLKMLDEIRGKLKASTSYRATSDGVPSDAIQKFHREILSKATDAIATQNVDRRYLSSMVMPVSSTFIDEAKGRIRDFRYSLNKSANTSDKKDEVYCLSIQFFSLTPGINDTRNLANVQQN